MFSHANDCGTAGAVFQLRHLVGQVFGNRSTFLFWKAYYLTVFRFATMVAYTVKLKIDRGRTINRWNLASPLSNTLPVLKVFSYPFFLLPGFNANVFVAAFLALPIKPLIAPVYSLLSPSCKTIELRACDQFGVL